MFVMQETTKRIVNDANNANNSFFIFNFGISMCKRIKVPMIYKTTNQTKSLISKLFIPINVGIIDQITNTKINNPTNFSFVNDLINLFKKGDKIINNM